MVVKGAGTKARAMHICTWVGGLCSSLGLGIAPALNHPSPPLPAQLALSIHSCLLSSPPPHPGHL